jgi:hypothetical protein
MESESFYQYFKIDDKGGIRLILLLPAPDLESSVQCSLIHTTLEECENDVVEHYVALSYVWGDSDQKISISIDGKKLEIGPSLEW